MEKRVYCLYRVSTKGQVEKDDIPMQRQVCQEYAKERDWTITREFYEKGISGFKVSAKDRDAVQEIQRDAALGKFDILLVFMFDRLGRKEDETPFVVEWFVRNGIEVWSAVEGQQRFDSHVDKLMNYIRYWQASGESLKTSVRVKTRLSQLVQEGKFRGGVAPMGYCLVKRGRLGKKNRELYDIQIQPEEAALVKKIFDIADRFGYGGRSIATALKEQGVINPRTGEPFHYATIQNILKNIMYMGILRSGETRSEIIAELQIIEPAQFERVAVGRMQRSNAYMALCRQPVTDMVTMADGTVKEIERPLSRCPRRVVGNALLSGNVFCGHCGGRIFATTGRRSHHATKKVNERVPVYKCYNRTQRNGLCNGPTSYRARKIDRVIEDLFEDIFSRAKGINENEFLRKQVYSVTQEARNNLRQAKADHTKAKTELGKWENMMLDSMEGNCVFTQEQIKRRMDTLQEKLQNLEQTMGELQTKIDHSAETAEEIRQEHRKLLSWSELYEGASMEEKKVIASNLIKAVFLSENYGISIELNIAEEQYREGLVLG